MNWIGRLFNELRRRRVFRMTAVYIITSWVVLQVADLLFPALGIDETALRYVWMAIIAGFPLAAFFSWRYDIGMGGITRTPPADDAPSESLALRITDYAVLLILLAIALFAVSTMTQHVIEEQAAINVAPETRDINPHSIAILPLENLSPETTERYFVSGMYDSLISSLGKVSALQVTSRTSASRVNTSQGVPFIGRKLGVANIVEGSIFRDGNQVRISVKLIDAASDQHIWSETYERPFDDVMAIQASVADAWYHLAWWFEMMGDDEEAIAAGEKTVELSPLSSFYISWLAEQYRDAQDYGKAIELAESVLSLNPNYPVAWLALGNAYLEQGRYEEAIAAHENLSSRPYWAFALGQTYAWAGQPEKALEIAQGYEHKPPFAIPLTIIYAALGDVEQTVYWMEQARNESLPWRMAMPGWFTAVRSLHEDPRIQAEAEKLGLPLIPYPKS